MPEAKMDLRRAIKSKSVEKMQEYLQKKGADVKQELMARNAANGKGMLMLAVTTGNVEMFQALAKEIETRVRDVLRQRREVEG